MITSEPPEVLPGRFPPGPAKGVNPPEEEPEYVDGTTNSANTSEPLDSFTVEFAVTEAFDET